ncbi:hypothetical protein PR048_000517 [Dryococelus australis]|uniref:Uncharacterized protein n=1 Tax=Dryococelus australis TaxID=614101 RepID=A0ABQ9IFG1_9NEOP|nr:hypothetical protein PR048_000517 [Dryococelus australis]
MVKLYEFNVKKLRKLYTISAYTRQKAKSKYRNRIRLERASQKQSIDTHKTPYDRVKRCRERKINIKASERVNVDVFTHDKRLCLQHSQTQFFFSPIGKLLRRAKLGGSVVVTNRPSGRPLRPLIDPSSSYALYKEFPPQLGLGHMTSCTQSQARILHAARRASCVEITFAAAPFSNTFQLCPCSSTCVAGRRVCGNGRGPAVYTSSPGTCIDVSNSGTELMMEPEVTSFYVTSRVRTYVKTTSRYPIELAEAMLPDLPVFDCRPCVGDTRLPRSGRVAWHARSAVLARTCTHIVKLLRYLWSDYSSPPRRTGSIPGEAAPGFSHVVIVSAYATGGRVFSGISRPPRPCILTLLHNYFVSPSSALNTSLLRTGQTSPLGDGVLDARGSLALIAPTLFNLIRVKQLQMGPLCCTLASHQGEPGSIPGRVTGFWQVGIVPDDAVGRWVFSGISRFPHPFISALLHTYFNHPPRLSRPRSVEWRRREVSMEQRLNEETGETGDPGENPSTNGIIRHDSHMRKSGSDREGGGGCPYNHRGQGTHELHDFYACLELNTAPVASRAEIPNNDTQEFDCQFSTHLLTAWSCDEGEVRYGVALERKGGGNGRTPRKPADPRHRIPTRENPE